MTIEHEGVKVTATNFKPTTDELKLYVNRARDLRRIGEMAFLDPNAYDQLKAKYRKRWTNTKKLTILEDMRRHYCKRKDNSFDN